MAEHFINKCSCGAVISQCRCMSKDKVETIVENGCSACQTTLAKKGTKSDAVRPNLPIYDKTNLGVPKKDIPKALEFEKIVIT